MQGSAVQRSGRQGQGFRASTVCVCACMNICSCPCADVLYVCVGCVSMSLCVCACVCVCVCVCVHDAMYFSLWTFRARGPASSSSESVSCAVLLIRQKQNQNRIAARDHPKCSCVMITFLALIIFHYFTLWLPTLIFWFVLIPGTLMWCTLAHMPGQRPWKIHIAHTSACIRSRSHTHNFCMHTLERTHARP